MTTRQACCGCWWWAIGHPATWPRCHSMTHDTMVRSPDDQEKWGRQGWLGWWSTSIPRPNVILARAGGGWAEWYFCHLLFRLTEQMAEVSLTPASVDWIEMERNLDREESNHPCESSAHYTLYDGWNWNFGILISCHISNTWEHRIGYCALRITLLNNFETSIKKKCDICQVWACGFMILIW